MTSNSSPTPSIHKIADVALANLTPSDRVLFHRYGLGPTRPVKTSIVHHAFETHARIQPNAIAVEHTLFNHSLTFGQLDVYANRLARRLRALGIQPGKRVCILARRSTHLIIAILATLKSGAQYVPLDAVTITDSTLNYVLEDSQPAAVIAMGEYVHRVQTEAPILELEPVIEADELAGADSSKPEDNTSPSDGAYVIYTSGTTGVPKGVNVKHRGVTNGECLALQHVSFPGLTISVVISGSPGNVGMAPGMRVAQLLNIAFDMGAWEILGSLYNGCTLCIRGNTKVEWIALMKTIDIVIATPSILAKHEPENYPNIKHVIVGGEVCPQCEIVSPPPPYNRSHSSKALADKWAQYTNFNNCCGPTEISICNTVQPHTSGYPLSIGKPIPNTNVYVLSRDPTSTKPIPIGQVGCMWVGGVGVSAGYLNLPEKTAERWKPDPFLGEGAMMFNTGDLGRWRKDGQLDHLGRADDQVKVKGFRVELDGVAAAMRVSII